MAQLVERLIRNQQIVSSNLTGGSIISRVYVQKQHINPCFILEQKRDFSRELFKISYACNGLRAKNFYPIATLIFFSRSGCKPSEIFLPHNSRRALKSLFPLQRQIPFKPYAHKALQTGYCYPIATLLLP